MRVCILGSSSSGNATLFVSGSTRVLLDAGFSNKEISRRVKEVGEDISRLSAIVITHEHSDHIRGVPVLARALKIPVFMARASFDTWGQANPKEKFEVAEFISDERSVEINGLVFRPFAVPHDAADTFGFTVEANGVKVGYVTDLGYVPKMVSERLRGSDALILEANHDLEMLRNGPYPWAVKQRVMSRHGHLSNDEVARFLSEDFDGRAQVIVLAHLSRTNNHPEIARLAAVQALSSRSPLFAESVENRVRLSHHDRPCQWIEL